MGVTRRQALTADPNQQRTNARRRPVVVGGEADRQQELLRIAADLFADRGYASTTVRDIATAAGILSGSLYHHFDTKESMIDEILSTFLTDTIARYEAIIAEGDTPYRTMKNLITVSLHAMASQRSAILTYQNEARFLSQLPQFAYLVDAHRRFESIWTGVLAQGIETGAFRSDINPKIAYRMIRDIVWTAPRWWRPGGAVRPEAIAEQYLGVLLGGLSAG